MENERTNQPQSSEQVPNTTTDDTGRETDYAKDKRGESTDPGEANAPGERDQAAERNRDATSQ